MNIQTVRFVAASDLLTPLDMTAISESDPDFSWGNNNRTLITVESLVNHIESNMDSEDFAGYNELLGKLKKLEADESPYFYIDLES